MVTRESSTSAVRHGGFLQRVEYDFDRRRGSKTLGDVLRGEVRGKFPVLSEDPNP